MTKRRLARKIVFALTFALLFMTFGTLLLLWLKIQPPNPDAVLVGSALLGGALGLWRER
jgi:RsiW-degrading membrane proteinase PrsW (M82 family)